MNEYEKPDVPEPPKEKLVKRLVGALRDFLKRLANAKLTSYFGRYSGDPFALLELDILEYTADTGLTILHLKIERVSLYIALEGK